MPAPQSSNSESGPKCASRFQDFLQTPSAVPARGPGETPPKTIASMVGKVCAAEGWGYFSGFQLAPSVPLKFCTQSLSPRSPPNQRWWWWWWCGEGLQSFKACPSTPCTKRSLGVPSPSPVRPGGGAFWGSWESLGPPWGPPHPWGQRAGAWPRSELGMEIVFHLQVLCALEEASPGVLGAPKPTPGSPKPLGPEDWVLAQI